MKLRLPRPGFEANLERWDKRLAVTVGIVMAIIIGLAIAAAAWMLLKTLTGTQVSGANPLETVFASRLMILIARLGILAIGLFIVLSVLVHMRRGQWLTAAGPFKVGGAARTVTHSLQVLRSQARVANVDRQRLQARVTDLTREVRTLEGLLEKAQAELRRKD